MSPAETPSSLLDAIRVVLCRPSHPGNVGAVARAMKVMGLHDLVIVAPRRPLPDEDATARATGASDVLDAAPIVAHLGDAVGDRTWIVGLSARSRSVGPPLVDLADAAAEALDRARRGRVAFLFGNERTGLENAELAACHMHARIPTSEALSSLNLAAAVQVVAYELRRTWLAVGGAAAEPTETPATRAQVDAFLARVWQGAAGHYRYREGDKRIDKLRTRFSLLVSRARPTREELRAAHGVLTWLSWDRAEGSPPGDASAEGEEAAPEELG